MFRRTAFFRPRQSVAAIGRLSLNDQTSTTLCSASTNTSVISYQQETIASRIKNINHSEVITSLLDSVEEIPQKPKKQIQRNGSLPPIQFHSYITKTTKSFQMKTEFEPKAEDPYKQKLEFQDWLREDQINLKKFQPRKFVNESQLHKYLEVSLNPIQESVKFSENKDQMIPLTLSIKFNDVENPEEIRQPIDLICVIDCSYSMLESKKLKLAKKTLLTLLKFLREEDRLQIIGFNQNANFLTGLWRVNASNKKIFENSINNLSASGGTDIAQGIRLALYQLENRKQKNNVTSIFLLSDGLDANASFEVRSAFQKFKIYDNFTINTFGFGYDHDSNLLAEISSLRDGNYYFIEQLDTLDECFVDALGGLASVACKNVMINLQTTTNQYQITRSYGNQLMAKDGVYRRSFQYIIFGTSKDLVFEMLIPAGSKKIPSGQRSQEIAIASVQMTDIKSGRVLKFKKHLKLNFYQADEEMPTQEFNSNVQLNYFRVKCAECIRQAIELCDLGNYQRARYNLQAMIRKLKKLPKSLQYGLLIEDLERQIQACSQDGYEQCEPAMVQAEHQWMNQMSQPQREKKSNHDSSQSSSYQNSTQLKYQSQVQSEKN